MKIHYIAHIFILSFAIATLFESGYYRQALRYLAEIPDDSYRGSPLYNNDNIDDNLYIPNYNSTLKDYDGRQIRHVPEIITKKVLPLLETAAAENDQMAMITLADIYTFGNYSVTVDYPKALQYYHKAVENTGNGHAYFMLGFMYSTGMFGEIDADDSKAIMYYQFGMENGDLNSIMALAYRHYYGIGTPENCELAMHYYSRLAHFGYDMIQKNIGDVDKGLRYNIKIVDFNGGLYGNKLSESANSIFSRTRRHNKDKEEFLEFFDIDDHQYINFYQNAITHYSGDYFLPKNYTRAFEYIQDCVGLGEQMYGSLNYHRINEIDSTFLSHCQALLGHMYLTGEGVPKNYDKAMKWLRNSIVVARNSEALIDLGEVYENGLGNESINTSMALSIYREAGETSALGKLKQAKLLMLMSPENDPRKGKFAKDIYSSIKKATFSGSTEGLYYFTEFLQSGLASQIEPERAVTCPGTTICYKVFVEKLEHIFLPQLSYAFEELIYGNFKNALLGYLMAAEQGLENAQISTAYLLYQLQPILSTRAEKSFDHERVSASVRYLERASQQDNVDATLLLGDMFLNGLHNTLEKDNDRAFNYYMRAAVSLKSSYGAYKVGNMYEYGLGPVNDSVDYFMAKRYYDLSIDIKKNLEDKTSKLSNKTPINWALLRLRLKYVFNRKQFKNQEESSGSSGWFNAFKKISNAGKQANEGTDRASDRARAHHEGGDFLRDDEFEEYDIGDYLVIFLTFMFFVVFFIQNVIRQARRMRQGNNVPNEEQQNQNGWNFRFNFNGIGAAARAGNFEFHFFAI